MTLREARQRAGLTIRQAAAKSGYARNTISRWEHGTPPPITSLVDICQTYGISIQDLSLEEWR